MNRKLVVPGVALAMLTFAVYHVVKAQQTPPDHPPPVEPSRSPYAASVAGTGIVEPRTENISIGCHLPGIVTQVAVTVGQTVKAGDVLFRVDDRQLKSELKVRQAALQAAEAQLARLTAMPRPEEVPPAETKLREAEANLHNWDDQFERTRKLASKRVVEEQEFIRVKQGRSMAVEQRDRAKAELELLMAGAWEADKIVARAAVDQAAAQVEMARTELDRLTVKAPVDGRVLQVNVRPGEFVGAPPSQALIVLGDIDRLHVRVDIDENDIPRFRPGQPATARLRGAPDSSYALKFVRVEPYVIPKKSLTGQNVERVDTRVLQVIYAIDGPAESVYVGQQVDVYLEASATLIARN